MAISLLERLAQRIERAEALDRPAGAVANVVSPLVSGDSARRLLSGEFLGHALHPMLTDIPIGAWTSALLLDVVGGRKSRPAARKLVGLGILAAVPAAATGAHDWSDTTGPDRRLGLVHAGANSVALALQGASWMARRQGKHLRAKALSAAGLGAVSVSGWLGGHLTFRRGVMVDRTAFEDRSDEWSAVATIDELEAKKPYRVDLDGGSVVLVRDGAQIRALAATCTHLGGPLHQGEVSDGCISCPWHGSRFSLEDGSVVRPPATAPQPAYEVRQQGDKIEIRAAEG